MAAKDELGARGERIAEEHLTRAGLAVLDRNWRCPIGEIDLVVRDPASGETVFVEVKTRSGIGYGHPLEAITISKLARLRRLAGAWCAERRDAGESVGSIRLDAVGVVVARDRAPQVEHLRGVFR
jgi:putative endonuclease